MIITIIAKIIDSDTVVLSWALSKPMKVCKWIVQ